MRILFFWILTIPILVQAQVKWNLQQCIQQIKSNNINVQQSKISEEINQLNYTQSKFNLYPSVNGNFNNSLLFGRSVDPTTYQFVNQTIFNSSWSGNVNAVLYNGFNKQLQIKQNKLNYEASVYDTKKLENDLILNFANAYLTYTLLKIQNRITENQKKLIIQQQERANKMVKSGALAAGNLLEFDSQLAQIDVALLNNDGQINQAVINLKQLLLLPLNENIQFEEIDIDKYLVPFDNNINIENYYDSALNTQPNIKSLNLKMQSANVGVNIAKAMLQPTVSVFGQLNSNYSSNYKTYEIVGLDYTNFQTIGITQNTNELVVAPSTIVEQNHVSYFKQFKNNFSQVVGIGLNIPIFNGFQARNNIKKAILNEKLVTLNKENSTNQLKQEIATALNNAKNAWSKISVNEIAKIAAEKSLENVQKRFAIGAANSFEITNASNTLYNAEINKNLAKVEYIFRLKILEFYLGKNIEF
jgi:outer membrane protein